MCSSPPRLRALLVLLPALFFAAPAGAESAAVPEGWFVWPSVEPADGSALDARAWNTARGASLPRIQMQDGRFVTPDGQRQRFWATNLAANEAFPPTPEEAAAIARRLAKAGVNLVRLHHLDNPWAVGKGGSIWPAGQPQHRELDPGQLDRLHRLMAALRDEGIYSNLNLKVSKTLAAEDGFDPSVSRIANFQKRVDIYDRRMIELQKDYARRLLTTKNPYTGLAPAEDPSVAFVEINNENSLLGYWTRDLGRGLEKFPAPFREDLRAQWNAWLARTYADDAALAKAWNATGTKLGEETLIPATAKWELRVQPGSQAALAPSADKAVQELKVDQASGIAWHVQASLRGLKLQDGVVYTLEFLAKADRPRQLGVGVGIDTQARPQDPWRSFGMLETVEIGTEWQVVRLAFPAHSVAGAPASLSLNAGQAPGTLSLKELKLVTGAEGAGLQEGQSASGGTVPLPLAPTARQWADWIAFLADTERSFAEEMRSFLRHELHVQAPIACSQIDYGGLTGMNREQSMEFADAHVYWQHPDFPADADWDPHRYTIRNSSQLDELKDRTFGALGDLALVRVAGKPYTISEYDHPAPSEFVCEMYPEIASFAARQDWDAVYTFVIGAYGAANPEGRIADFFDQLNHPAKWGQSIFAAGLFRHGLVPPAPAANELKLGQPLWAEQPHAEVLWRALIPAGPLNLLNVRYAVSDRPGAPGAKATLARHAPSAPAPMPVRLAAGPSGRLYLIDAEQAAAVVGFLGGGKSDVGPLHLACEKFGRNFASVTALALDGKPLRASGRVLVTAVARANNQGAAWNEAHNSLGENWGHGPTIAEHVPVTVTLAGLAGREVFALKPDGSRGARVETESADGALTFAARPAYQTLHYEIVAR